MEFFNYLGSMITNNASYTPEKTEYRTVMAKAAFNKKKALFTSNWT
jgi:hypothetical protein